MFKRTPFYAITSGSKEYLSACEKALDGAFSTCVNSGQGIIYVQGLPQLDVARRILMRNGLYYKGA